jgi:hypothetical protein
MNHPPADLPHLTREQKQEWAGALRSKGWSYPRIAGALGVVEGSVREWCSTSQNYEVEQTTGSDGKAYPADQLSDDEIQERRRKVWESLEPTPQGEACPLDRGRPGFRRTSGRKQGILFAPGAPAFTFWTPEAQAPPSVESQGRRRWARWQG